MNLFAVCFAVYKKVVAFACVKRNVKVIGAPGLVVVSLKIVILR